MTRVIGSNNADGYVHAQVFEALAGPQAASCAHTHARVAHEA